MRSNGTLRRVRKRDRNTLNSSPLSISHITYICTSFNPRILLILIVNPWKLLLLLCSWIQCSRLIKAKDDGIESLFLDSSRYAKLCTLRSSSVKYIWLKMARYRKQNCYLLSEFKYVIIQFGFNLRPLNEKPLSSSLRCAVF